MTVSSRIDLDRLENSSEPVAWYALNPDEALQTLGSDRQEGLSAEEIRDRQAKFGLNELTEKGGRPAWEILLDQFKNIMLIMLILVAIVSAVLDFKSQQFPKDAVAIGAIVILNGILGYLQESRAEKALAALKRMASPRVRVIRQGQETEVDAKELVPGDLVQLDSGVQVPADGRLMIASNLQLRESALTGEAEAVTKQAEIVLPDETALGDRINQVFQGTEVLQGRGTALITATGMRTELGRIALMLQDVETEPTPLQVRMTQLGNVLVTGSMVLVALVVIGGIIREGNFSMVDQLLEVSLSMAVAVVPEGLPAVITVTLALGTQRMIRRNALIRKLPAVETLGSVTTICSDKTGTLTQNKMVVQQVQTLDQTVLTTGQGYSPEGNLVLDGQNLDPKNSPALHQLLQASALCNDSVLQKENGEWMILGDPTEGSLLVLAAKGGLETSRMVGDFPRVAEVPFTSERKRMSVVCSMPTETKTVDGKQSPSPYRMFSKGSPELVAQRCSSVMVGGQPQPMTDVVRQKILDQNNQMAQKGLRVLGLAYKPLSELPAESALETEERHLNWLGLVGILDAPRPEVRSAVAQCRQAGIRPVMITGDHQLTAMAIAQDLGIAEPDARVLTGQELDKLTPEEFSQQVGQVNVYARVAPEHKLKIVQALQKRNEFVAMTGDGVNDAPALKQADIGIAMGITGTDVSKEASDMVLLDDNFATIVAATEEGRVIYDNIRRFIKYILGSNIGEVITIAAAPILGLGGVPLSPLQILWMNLVTDGLPALALALEPAESNVMQRPPHQPRESIFARGLGFYMIRVGLILAILSIVLMAWAYQYTHASGYAGNPDTWKSMVFTTLCLAQMGHAMAVRSDSRLTIQLNPVSNPYLLWSVILTTVLQLLLLYVPPLQAFFGTHPLSVIELLICLGFSALMFVWIEIEKVFILKLQARRSQPNYQQP
jgi:P-type Ca2+ transporter type 2C